MIVLNPLTHRSRLSLDLLTHLSSGTHSAYSLALAVTHLVIIFNSLTSRSRLSSDLFTQLSITHSAYSLDLLRHRSLIDLFSSVIDHFQLTIQTLISHSLNLLIHSHAQLTRRSLTLHTHLTFSSITHLTYLPVEQLQLIQTLIGYSLGSVTVTHRVLLHSTQLLIHSSITHSTYSFTHQTRPTRL